MIFALLAILAAGVTLRAQQPVGSHALKLRGSAAPQVGTILSADGRIVQFQTQAGTVGYPLANVESAVMPPPPEYGLAQQAVAAKDNKKALQFARSVYDKFKGLPVDWAKVSALMVADLLIAEGDTEKAEGIFREFEQYYPGGGGLQAKVGRARIAVARKDLLSAKDSLASVTEEALKQKTVPRENAFAYSQAFYVMGLVNEADGKPQDALENYLRTVTIFFHDPSSRAAAQERADALRASNTGKKTSEHLTAP
jgi:hypothetical protein